MDDILLNVKNDLFGGYHKHYIIFFDIIKKINENIIFDDECVNLNEYIFESEEFEFKDFEIKNNFLKIESYQIDMLCYIETDKKINKVYTLLGDNIINKIDSTELIRIDNKYYFNNINNSNGILMKYFDSCNVIILFDDILNEITNKIKIVYKKLKFIPEVSMFMNLMKNYNMRKLYGIPYVNGTSDTLEKIELS